MEELGDPLEGRSGGLILLDLAGSLTHSGGGDGGGGASGWWLRIVV